MNVENYNDDFYVVSEVLSEDEVAFYSKYFFENSTPDLMSSSANMLFFGLDHLNMEGGTEDLERRSTGK